MDLKTTTAEAEPTTAKVLRTAAEIRGLRETLIGEANAIEAQMGAANSRAWVIGRANEFLATGALPAWPAGATDRLGGLRQQIQILQAAADLATA